MYNELDYLRKIGTPKAAIALVPFLWHKNDGLASRAALNLATLLPKPDVENALRDYPLTKEQRKAKWFNWVWAPFNEYEPVGSSLSVIAGRIVYLINLFSESEVIYFEATLNLEPRIFIPLAVLEQSKWKIIVNVIVGKAQQPKEEFVKLKSILEDEGTPAPTLNDWKNIFTPTSLLQKQISEIKRENPLVILGLLLSILFWTLYKKEDIAILFIILWISFIVLTPLAYLKLKRKLKNPLHGLLEPPKNSHASAKKKQPWWRWFRK
jgi:hypothetical protein